MTHIEYYKCDKCNKMHGKNTKGIIVIENLHETSSAWGMGFKTTKKDLSFCDKECLKKWIDEVL